jgi:hypothetical protein
VQRTSHSTVSIFDQSSLTDPHSSSVLWTSCSCHAIPEVTVPSSPRLFNNGLSFLSFVTINRLFHIVIYIYLRARSGRVWTSTSSEPVANPVANLRGIMRNPIPQFTARQHPSSRFALVSFMLPQLNFAHDLISSSCISSQSQLYIYTIRSSRSDHAPPLTICSQSSSHIYV